MKPTELKNIKALKYSVFTANRGHLLFKTLLILITTCSLMVIFSCEKEEVTIARDGDGVIISKPYQWRTSLSTDGRIIESFIRNDIHNESVVALASQHGAQSKISFLSIENGEIEWVWDDLFNKDLFFDIGSAYNKDNVFVFQYRKSFYRIDLTNASTLNKDLRAQIASFMSGLGDRYFTSGNYFEYTDSQHIGNIYSGNIHSELEELLLTPDYSYEHTNGNGFTGVIGAVTPFIDSDNGDTLLIYDFADMLPDYNANLFIGLYNLSKKSSIYTKVNLLPNAHVDNSGRSIVYNDKAYFFPAKSIICVDPYTGNRLWITQRDQNASNCIIVNDVLVLNCEDTYLYGLDPDTGQQLWKEKGSGTSSRMASLNGVVYFTGGGDGLLHAIEAETGKHLWKIKSPDLEQNSGAWFKRRVSVIPGKNDEKGKVITSSYLSAFCYEAER